MVKTFGIGIYELPASKVDLFMQIMTAEAKHQEKKASTSTPPPKKRHGRY